jgi:hypothetical protein
MLAAGNVGHHRPAPGDDQDTLGGDGPARHLDRVGIGKDGARLEQLDPVGGEDVAVDAVEPRDLGVLVGDQRRPVEALSPTVQP